MEGTEMAFVKRNFEHNGLEIYFSSIPSASVLTKLKSNGWRWHRQKRCWYNRYSENNYSFANCLCNDENRIEPSTSSYKKENLHHKSLQEGASSLFTIGEFVEFKSEYFGRQYGTINNINTTDKTAEITYHYSSPLSSYDAVFTDNAIPWGDIKKYSKTLIQTENVEDSPFHASQADEVYNLYGLRKGDKVTFTSYEGFEAVGVIATIVSAKSIYVDYTYYAYKQKKTGYGVYPASMLTKDLGYKKYNYDQLSEEKQQEIDFNTIVKKRIKSRTDTFSDIKPTQKNNVLFKHQKAGCLLAERYKKFAFFYDTGTGKTVMALDIINSKFHKDGTRFLIIAPKAIIQTAWMEDAKKYYPDVRILPLTTSFGTNKQRRLLEQWKSSENQNSFFIRPNRQDNYLYFLATLSRNESLLDMEEEIDNRSIKDMVQHYIINPELFIRTPEKYIRELGIGGLVIDESAIMKNHESITTKVLLETASKMKYVYLLSGKPAPNNELEYYSQMKTVDPETFSMSYSSFAKDFGVDPSQRKIWLDNEAKETLSKLISARSLIISKDDCLDLPSTVESVHQFELPNEVMAEYDRLYANCLAVIKGMDHSARLYTSTSKLAVLMKLRQLASGFFIVNNENGEKSEREIIPIHESKTEELENILDEIGNEQVIIWCQFKYEILQIEKLLSKRGKVVTAYGGTKDVNESIADFKEGRAKYIIAHPRTLKYGVTFTNCRYAIYYSFSYRAEDYDQSHDRIYRLGQTKKCTFFFLQAANTIDELMYEKVMNKLSNAEFFEWLIKDASRHGIDYEHLKECSDDDYSGISDDLILEKKREETINSLNSASREYETEFWVDSYGELWTQGKSEAEKEIDELIALTDVSYNDLSKLHRVIDSMLEDSFIEDSMRAKAIVYRHCLDLKEKKQRSWNGVGEKIYRTGGTAQKYYLEGIRHLRHRYHDVIKYLSDVYLLNLSYSMPDIVHDKIFDCLTPPDPTQEEMAELQIFIDDHLFETISGKRSVFFRINNNPNDRIGYSITNCYYLWGNLYLVLKIDGLNASQKVECVLDDTIIVYNGFQKALIKPLKAVSEHKAIAFEKLKVYDVPFSLSEGDTIDIYTTLILNTKISKKGKVHFKSIVTDYKDIVLK